MRFLLYVTFISFFKINIGIQFFHEIKEPYRDIEFKFKPYTLSISERKRKNVSVSVKTLDRQIARQTDGRTTK